MNDQLQESFRGGEHQQQVGLGLRVGDVEHHLSPKSSDCIPRSSSDDEGGAPARGVDAGGGALPPQWTDSRRSFPLRHNCFKGAALVLFAGLALAVGTAQAAKNPLAVTITPTPFYSDLTKMRVTFRTPTVAPAGHRYFIRWQTLSPPSLTPEGCAGTSRFDIVGVRGGTNRLVAFNLRPEELFGDAFCPGPSQVLVFTQRATAKGRVSDGATRKTLKLLADYRFRVLRPQ